MQTQEEGSQQFLFILCLWHAYNKNNLCVTFRKITVFLEVNLSLPENTIFTKLDLHKVLFS